MGFKHPHFVFKGWELLKHSRLVTTKKCTPENIKYFLAILNNSYPKSDLEKTYYDLIRYQFITNKYGFIKMIKDTRIQPFILWTNGYFITKALGINSLIKLKWANEQYYVDFNPDEVSSNEVSSDQVSSDEISSNEVSFNKVGSDQVSSDEISSNEVSSDQVSFNKVSSNKVSSNEVSSNKVSSNEVSSDKVSFNKVDSNKVSSNEVKKNWYEYD